MTNSTNKRLTIDEFISRAVDIHGSRYDYSNFNYINTNTKSEIICQKHGVFLQTPHNHLCGKKCPKCSVEHASIKISNKNKNKIKHEEKLTTETFIEKAKLIHGNKYDYSKSEYKTLKTKCAIICDKHGIFWQTPDSHIYNKSGCKKCNKNQLDIKNFIEKAKLIHGNKYDYSKSEYKNYNTKILIICPKHGEFWQKPSKHLLRQHGCPVCKESKGEANIFNFLNLNNINYIRQKTFDKLIGIGGGKLKFDFYIPKLNLCIEYDGPQHYNDKSFKFKNFKSDFESIVANDNIKNKFCIDNNIKLIRIPYYESNNIKNTLNRLFGLQNEQNLVVQDR